MGYTLRLVVNRYCNFKCFFCYQEGTVYPKSGSISYETFISLVRSFSTVRPLVKVRITGGEPLVYPDLLSLLEGIRAEFPVLDLGITTNASIPNKLIHIAKIFSSNPLHINISLPSLYPKTFETITRSSKYPQTMHSIEQLVAQGLSSNTSINYVYMPHVNDLELPAIVDFTRINRLRLKMICLTINNFNRKKVEALNVEPSEEYLLRDKVLNLGYVQTSSRSTFIKDGHSIEIVNCFSQQPIPYFNKFKTLRVYYDGRVGITGDYDNFIRIIDLNQPEVTFNQILDDVENTMHVGAMYV